MQQQTMLHLAAVVEPVDPFERRIFDRLNRALLSSIGNGPPAEAEADYYAGLEELMIAA